MIRSVHTHLLATVPAITAMKGRWRASVAAIGRRLHDLGLITDYHYTKLNKELSRRGRANEPAPIARQTSVVLGKALAAPAEEGLDLKGIAHSLHLPASEIRALTFGLQTIDGGSRDAGAKGRSLRLVR